MRSPRPVSLSSLAALAILTAATQAQRTFIVDQRNRPGTHFTDLPAAEAAAQHGDILVLRADGGVYSAITTSKALTILGDFASIRVSRGAPFRVTGLPAGRDFVLQRCMMILNQTPAAPMIELLQCAGNVHLQSVTLSNLTGGPAVTALGCTAVTVRESDLEGTPGLVARNSTVSANAARISGVSTATLPSSEAIRLEHATLQLAACWVAGSSNTTSAAPAMVMAGSTARIGGAPNNGALLAGPARGSAPVPAVRGQSSLVEIDPVITVIARGGAPAFEGVTALSTLVPTLIMDGTSQVFMAFHGDPTAANVTLVGLPRSPFYSPALTGSLWLTPDAHLVLPGVLTGLSTRNLPQGATIVLQIASVTAGGIALSNPGVVTAP